MSIIIFTYCENYLDNLKQEVKKISNVLPLKPQSLIVHVKIMTWKKNIFLNTHVVDDFVNTIIYKENNETGCNNAKEQYPMTSNR